MSLPVVQEIRRWNLQPGDRLILRTDAFEVTAEQATALRESVRAALNLPPDVPIVILARNWDIEVVTADVSA